LPLRLYASLTSINNNVYDVEIHDTEWAGSTAEFRCANNGFTIEYFPENDERFCGIIATTGSIDMFVDDTDTALQSFLVDLVDAPESQFRLVVYLNSNLYWLGNFLTDQIEKEDDRYPFIITLTATDIIGTLKNIPFDVYTTGWVTYFDLFKDIITRLNTLSMFSDISPTINLLKYVFNWWPDNLTYAVTTNPLEVLRIRINTFIELDSKGQPKDSSYYDVLFKLCTELGCTFIFTNGIYWILQQNEYIDTTWIVHTYDVTFTKVTSSLGSIPTKTAFTELDKVVGFTERYYPPLAKVEVKYNYFEGANLLREDTIKEADGGVILEDVNSNSGVASFRMSGKLWVDMTQWRIDNMVPYDLIFVNFRIRISIADGGSGYSFSGGSRVISDGAGGTFEQRIEEKWQTGITNYFYVAVKVVTSNLGYNRFALPEFTNPLIPADGDMTISIGISDIWRFNTTTGVWVNSVTNFPDFDIQEPYFEVFYDGIPGGNFDILTYAAENQIDKNTKILSIDTYHGDGPTPAVLGKIQVSNDSGLTWVDTNQWRVGNTGSFVKISQLLANEIIKGQIKSTPRMIGKYNQIYHPYEKLLRSTRAYIFHSGRFIARDDSITGEWHYVAVNTIPTIPPPLKIGTTIPIPGRTPNFPASDDGRTTPVKFPEPTIIPALSPTTTVDFIDSGTIITEIQVVEITQAGVYNEGDIIRVITQTGLEQIFIITQDAAIGDTVLHVQSATTDFSIPSGSYIIRDDIGDGNGQFAGIYAYVDQTSIPISINVTNGVWATVNITELFVYSVRFSASVGSGTAVYDGTATQLFWAIVTISFGVSSNNSSVAFAIAKNGVRNIGSVIYSKRVQSAASNQVVSIWLDFLANGDEVSVEVLADYTGTVDLEGFTVLLLPAASGGLIQQAADTADPPIRYKQIFPTVTGTTVTVTVNGGVLPGDTSKIDVLRNGVEMSPSYWTVSGSDIIYTGSYPYDNEEITVKFFYP